jgi:hypothetical protein
LLTLYITPVVYIYLDAFGRWLRARRWVPAVLAKRGAPEFRSPDR